MTLKQIRRDEFSVGDKITAERPIPGTENKFSFRKGKIKRILRDVALIQWDDRNEEGKVHLKYLRHADRVTTELNTMLAAVVIPPAKPRELKPMQTTVAKPVPASTPAPHIDGDIDAWVVMGREIAAKVRKELQLLADEEEKITVQISALLTRNQELQEKRSALVLKLNNIETVTKGTP